ncbi:hypothetical protein J2Z31_005356 [Sinorhizobium kostiense]|uniref:Transposase n=1 Tax=Sinorhizobium kostiense TaxID=76747 RepID=A0ABS4R922_9HYPH|nr:hypothetical protein [Sinorhizobium kostiense]
MEGIGIIVMAVRCRKPPRSIIDWIGRINFSF